MIEAVFGSIADDADDFCPDLAFIECDTLPDRVFVRPAVARHGLIDGRDAWGFRIVVFGKSSASKQRLAQSLEIFRADGADVYEWFQITFAHQSAFDLKAVSVWSLRNAAWIEREAGGERRRLNGSYGSDLPQNVVREGDVVGALVASEIHADAHREQAVGIEARV